MGLICRSSLLVRYRSPFCALLFFTNLARFKNVMPALVETIKELGLVLVADTSDDVGETARFSNFAATDVGIAGEWTYRMPEGVNGVMRGSGVLRFNDTIDM